jgi:hypothetical protein
MAKKRESAKTRRSEIALRGMLVKFCSCGYPIGVETTSDPYRFYAGGDWNSPVEACPSCHQLIEADRLDFSEEQAACLASAYRYLRTLARRANQTQE